MGSSMVLCATCGAANPASAATCFACGNPPQVANPQAYPSHAGSNSGSFTGLLPTDSILRQRYRLRGQLGKGGFGAVYRAEDTQLGNRIVAVKEMSQRSLTPEELKEAAEAFQREALMLAGLSHPNLPDIYDHFTETGRWYLVMKFIEGESLEDRLKKVPGGRLAIEQALQIGLQLTKVLGYLHARQPPIIFRDLKPSNIMLTAEGHVYLIDFGIARLFKPGQAKDTEAFGSAGYAAPEQYGKAQTTPQADIYSLGATLHHVLSGIDPSDNPFIFKPLYLTSAPALETLIMQMLKQEKTERPASMQAVGQELQRIADELATGQRRASSVSIPAFPPLPLPQNPPITSYRPPSSYVPNRPPSPSYIPTPQVAAKPAIPNDLTPEELAIIAHATQSVSPREQQETLNDWRQTLASGNAPQRARGMTSGDWTIMLLVVGGMIFCIVILVASIH